MIIPTPGRQPLKEILSIAIGSKDLYPFIPSAQHSLHPERAVCAIGCMGLLGRLLVHWSISNATCVRKKGIAVHEQILAHCTLDRSTFPFRF
jgi:hypothetical protein